MRFSLFLRVLPLLGLPVAVAAGAGGCTGVASHSFGSGGQTSTSPAGGAGGGGAATGSTSSSSSSSGDTFIDAGHFDGGTGGGGIINCTPGGPDDDVDHDGFTPNQGDCDDCDPNVNPNAVEVPTPPGETPKDENCNGMVDEVAPTCDTGIDVAEMDPMAAAHAVDLCKASTGANDWGVVSAKWVLPDGSPPPTGQSGVNFHLGHGMLSAFGSIVKVRNGARMLGLSSGTARQPKDPGYQSVNGFDKGYTANSPMGFPKESPACPGTITGQPHDATGVELTINTPSNATGFAFDFDFFTFEWPGYICSQYNDFFVALLSPIPMGQTDGNISFDTQGNPVSVNNAFLEVCGCDGNPPSPCFAGGKQFTCSLGDTDLIGTGFGFDTNGGSDHGSTGWLQTKAPVAPNSQITIRWAVYDSGDGVLDTSTLVDNWRWIANAGVDVGTSPVPK